MSAIYERTVKNRDGRKGFIFLMTVRLYNGNASTNIYNTFLDILRISEFINVQ